MQPQTPLLGGNSNSACNKTPMIHLIPIMAVFAAGAAGANNHAWLRDIATSRSKNLYPTNATHSPTYELDPAVQAIIYITFSVNAALSTLTSLTPTILYITSCYFKNTPNNVISNTRNILAKLCLWMLIGSDIIFSTVERFISMQEENFKKKENIFENMLGTTGREILGPAALLLFVFMARTLISLTINKAIFKTLIDAICAGKDSAAITQTNPEESSSQATENKYKYHIPIMLCCFSFMLIPEYFLQEINTATDNLDATIEIFKGKADANIVIEWLTTNVWLISNAISQSAFNTIHLNEYKQSLHKIQEYWKNENRCSVITKLVLCVIGGLFLASDAPQLFFRYSLDLANDDNIRSDPIRIGFTTLKIIILTIYFIADAIISTLITAHYLLDSTCRWPCTKTTATRDDSSAVANNPEAMGDRQTHSIQ